MNSPIQNFVWGNNKRDGVFSLPPITFKGHLRINTNKFPQALRKIRFRMALNEAGSYDYKYFINYIDGVWSVKKNQAENPNGVVVPPQEIGMVRLMSYAKINNLVLYEIRFDFTYTIENGQLIKGIDENIILLSSFSVQTYTDPDIYPTSMPSGIPIEENSRNHTIIAELGEVMSPTQNIFGYRTQWFPDEPSTLKRIQDIYGTNTISLDYTSI